MGNKEPKKEVKTMDVKIELKKTPRPVNQKSIYHAFADVYEKLMNDEIVPSFIEISS